VDSLGIKNMNLLAYHNFGESKYYGLNRNYPLKGVEKISGATMEKFYECANKYVDFVQIGG
jgi:pyruvate formate lyase activating enzyme